MSWQVAADQLRKNLVGFDALRLGILKTQTLKKILSVSRQFFVRVPSQYLLMKCGTGQFWNFENEFWHFEKEFQYFEKEF